MARKLDFKDFDDGLELKALATSAITGNPTAGVFGSGLFVKFDTDAAAFVLAAAGDEPLGIVDSNVAAGAPAQIKIGPRLCFVKVGVGGVTALDYVQVGTNGRAITATFAKPIAGQVLVTGVENDVVPILLGKQPTLGGAPVASLGANVASAAAITLTGHVQHITGTDAIASIATTGCVAGTTYTLIFDDILTFTDGNDLKLAGNMTTSAGDTITLAFDGTNFYEVARSAN